ncbi:pilus assembly protein N-terminal domain-containing protein [Lichenifustis flavocetrariae]|uniref:Pilus assembly protein N-terminal domain-containing protein n=1 Tax=Lichenifustis flavocetrariae TaxID=2949735 RepID=A0AA41YT13_9HYPH|nr:pilus assembly protein N-terminal domain-containing protein [Lichenifustis flavocetrariae]MCW6506487.1 pilus assembly protein N-terminal domain-containing protein [Lichenifustis flavocetrariae]
MSPVTEQSKSSKLVATGRMAIALAMMLGCLSPAWADGSSDRVFVSLDKAKLIKLPANVETVVVGNPSIADVTLMKKTGLMIVTGKGFGETNIILLDPTGQALSEAIVTVRTGQSTITVQRGMDRESYSCAPRCEPAVALGDATKFLADTSAQITSRNGLVMPGQH